MVGHGPSVLPRASGNVFENNDSENKTPQLAVVYKPRKQDAIYSSVLVSYLRNRQSQTQIFFFEQRGSAGGRSRKRAGKKKKKKKMLPSKKIYMHAPTTQELSSWHQGRAYIIDTNHRIHACCTYRCRGSATKQILLDATEHALYSYLGDEVDYEPLHADALADHEAHRNCGVEVSP